MFQTTDHPSNMPPSSACDDENVNSPDPCNTPTTEDTLLLQRINQLSRERPKIFHSRWHEVLFVFSISITQFLTEFFVSGFVVILPTLMSELDIPQAASVWPATAFSLAIASTLLVFGRVGDMWGCYPVFLFGLVWLTIWSIIAGFSFNPLMLDLCRALQGLGAAAFLPTGVGIMGSLYRPGPRKNLVFAIYGFSGVFGFFGGIFIAGIVGQFLRWGFYFWIGGIVAAIDLVTFLVSVPGHPGRSQGSKHVEMDYLGAAAIVSGLVLTVFSITQSAHAELGWQTPYIIITFTVGILALLVAVYVETMMATQPLLPASIFRIPSMTALIIGVFLLYGTWGIFSVYGTLYFQKIMGAGPLQVVAWYVPLGLAGLILSILEGFILHLVPGKVLLIISGTGALGAQLLLALIPGPGANYWAWIFPATIMSTIGIDLSTILMTVFVTNKVPAKQQGLAGGVVNSVLQLGVAFVLGLTDILQSAEEPKLGLAKSYKTTFWFGVGASAVGVLIFGIWGRVPKATGELTEQERDEVSREIEGGP